MTVGKNYIYKRGAIPFSDHVDNQIFGTTEETLTVPADARLVVIQGSDDFGIREGATAIAFADSTGAGDGSEIMNAGVEHLRKCVPGSTLHVISTNAAIVMASFAYYLDPDISTS